MIVIEEHVDIARPVNDVYHYMADGFLDHLRAWNPAIIEMTRMTEGPVRVGTTAHEVQLIQGKRRERTFRVTRMERDRVFEVQNVGESGVEKHYLGRYRFEPNASGGTRLTQRFELTWDDPMFRFVPWLPKIFIRKSIREAQQVMKREIEAT